MSECTVANEFLCKHSMFGGLQDDELLLIKSYLQEHTYPQNTVILQQGQSNNSVHFIVEGEVAIVRQAETSKKQSRIITTLHKGDSFGEMELIDIQSCAASVISLTETHIITLSNKDLYQISLQNLKTYTMLILNLARDISRRLRSADEMLALSKNRSTLGPASSSL
ncbi:cyclic nucleotide-binding domain-containing protein [Sphaerochaeta globosa]|uniref:Putative transcriptional regulator, Crp/Fnr family n=1 Tax=Sphaerochaeta globosa (strain ATCC BAA-1886 / DSM 22777 / Buddy) TaxID=158189 RepID=F0RW54_SPHGB|nr:cyclic nucleotide-binding domain-containing protein [Sphaerochaeta globosa]ADY13411.1 putative transcriptional regulator, Crp/Fnr family [Sphaerochaeta globosa str. Buddy]